MVSPTLQRLPHPDNESLDTFSDGNDLEEGCTMHIALWSFLPSPAGAQHNQHDILHHCDHGQTEGGNYRGHLQWPECHEVDSKGTKFVWFE
jgi:hypothetical protein